MQKYDIAAYVWPAYTGDELRTRMFWPEGIGEWQTVKNEVRDYPEYSEKRKPVWGYVNEADPYVMEMEIAAAADHGVNVFIYDWYWYDGRPFLENCLNDGFLKARNNDRMKFYLMWANHDVGHGWDVRTSSTDCSDTVIWKGSVDAAEFDKICDRVIEKYFTHPLYYKIDDCPVFMIYDLENLIKGLGGIENTKKKMDEFKQKCINAGLKGLHLQITQWGDVPHNLSGFDNNTQDPDLKAKTAEICEKIGFDSATNYQYVHMVDVNQDYMDVTNAVAKCWESFYQQYHGAYYPHVSIGWDNNPRYRKFMNNIIKNNPPEKFEEALRMAKEFMETHETKAPLITINSWNEWTETSYLQPDYLYGYGYLEAVKKVFVDENSM